MLGKKFEKKTGKEDPQEALDASRKMLNTGFMAGFTKTVFGKDDINRMNGDLDKLQAAVDMQKSGQWIAQSGMDATAEVLSIQDTGSLINMNPVVILQLKVQPVVGAEFTTTAQTMVSKIAIPRVGDKIKIKYNPANPSQLAVL